MYEDGKGVEPDDEEAVKWYRLSAEQGDASAQWHLGLAYANGEGVEQAVAVTGTEIPSTKGQI